MQIRLTDKDKKQIAGPGDVYGIMQRILLRDNRIDREKEHFWIVGLDIVGYILYIELVSLGSGKATVVEPMNVYRLAVMKNASRVIAVHNHPGGNLTPSDHDKDITDRLIQVGRILGITMADHLIISTKECLSFHMIGLMDKLAASLKYVPTFQVKEELLAVKQALKAETAAKEEAAKEAKEAKAIAIKLLLEKNMTTEEIAKTLKIPPEEIEKAINKKK